MSGSSVAAGVVRLVGVIGVLACGCWWGAGVASATTGHAFAGEFGSRGDGDGQFNEGSGNGPAGLAVMASTGDVFALDGSSGGARVQQFDAVGVAQGSFAIDQSHEAANAVAVGPAGAVYVRTLVPFGPTMVLKYSVSGVFAYALDVGGSGISVNFSECAGLAVDPVDGTVFVAGTDSSGGSGDREVRCGRDVAWVL